MKEMLFIMVAILVPPTLTYLGFVGESHAQRPEVTWERPALEQPTQTTASAGTKLCWCDSSF